MHPPDHRSCALAVSASAVASTRAINNTMVAITLMIDLIVFILIELKD